MLHLPQSTRLIRSGISMVCFDGSMMNQESQLETAVSSLFHDLREKMSGRRVKAVEIKEKSVL